MACSGWTTAPGSWTLRRERGWLEPLEVVGPPFATGYGGPGVKWSFDGGTVTSPLPAGTSRKSELPARQEEQEDPNPKEYREEGLPGWCTPRMPHCQSERSQGEEGQRGNREEDCRYEGHTDENPRVGAAAACLLSLQGR